jgi:hypothetical protein
MIIGFFWFIASLDTGGNSFQAASKLTYCELFIKPEMFREIEGFSRMSLIDDFELGIQ